MFMFVFVVDIAQTVSNFSFALRNQRVLVCGPALLAFSRVFRCMLPVERLDIMLRVARRRGSTRSSVHRLDKLGHALWDASAY